MSKDSRPTLHIYCDGGGVHGYGHIRRSLTLSERLKKDGFIVKVIGLSAEAEALLPFICYQHDEPQVVILDCPPGIGVEVMKSANQKAEITLGLDWFSSEALPFINISIYPHYPVLSLHKSFVGFEYILIRDEIKQVKNKNITGTDEYVFVSIGGGDLLKQGGAIANKLASLGYSVLLVNGPLQEDCEFNDLESKVQVIKTPSNFSELMSRSKFVISNGGGCLFEALYLGKAVVAIPQTRYEKNIIEHVNSLGAILGSGSGDVKNYSEFEMTKVGFIGERLVDGSGDKRISSIIRSQLEMNTNCQLF